jgi:predicted small lipoprotein YifL
MRGLLLLLLATSLCACGQKAALYLPDAPPQQIGAADGAAQTDSAAPIDGAAPTDGAATTDRHDEGRKRIH